MADYMRYALGREETRVLALLLETVRDPAGFRAELERAAALDVPVIALKVGRTEGSKAMVTAHSGALAGEHGAYEALFDANGVHEVRTLEEMADAMELFSSPRRVGAGRGIASVHDSGGERALFVDRAHDLGVAFAAISPETLAADRRRARPRARGREPARRLGHRHRRRPHLPGVVPGVARRPRHRCDGVRGRPHPPGGALRRGLPAGREGRLARDDEALLRAVEPGERRRARGSGGPARSGHPGARRHVVGSGRAPSADRSPRCAGAGGRRASCARAPTRCVLGGGSGSPLAARSASSRGWSCSPTTACR